MSMVQPEPTQQIVDEFVGAAHGDFAKVKMLLEQYPALVNAGAYWHETALGAAAQTGRVEIVEFLLAAGAPLDIFAAAMLGQARRVQEFLDADPSLVHARGAHSLPILWYPVIHDHRAVAELLLNRGADVNAGDGGNTALHAAALFNRPGMAGWLIDHGAGVNVRDYEGKTPLAIASRKGYEELAELLRHAGAAE